MEVVFVVFAVFMAAIALATMFSWHYKNQVEARARSCNGNAVHVTWGDSAIHLPEGTITFHRGGKNSPGTTRFVLRCRGAPRFHLSPRSLVHAISRFFGASQDRIGDRDLDERYTFSAGDLRAAATLRRAGVRQALDGLQSTTRGLFGQGQVPTVESSSGEVSITVPRDLASDGSLFDAALRWAQLLRDHLRPIPRVEPRPDLRVRAAPRRIGAIQARSRGVVSEVRCPICRDDIGGARRECSGCRAAYHAECWDELGGCATLGCKKMYRRSKRRQQT